MPIEQDSEIIFVTAAEEGVRLDKLLASRFEARSRTYFQYLIDNECVTVNSSSVKKGFLPKTNDEITISFIKTPEITLTPENIPLDILFEDEHLLVVNKPAGMVVHPAPGHWSSTFVNALLFHCKTLPQEEGDLRPGIVHRLDKDTSGILIASKTLEAHQKLITLFQSRKVSKDYLGICIGKPVSGIVSAPIGRHPRERKEMAVVESGKEAITNIQVLAFHQNLSLILAQPITGRTHQIRVHLQHIKAPILGDEIYGNPKMNHSMNVKRQLLHAYRIRLPHPILQTPLHLVAPIPDDIKENLSRFEKKSTTASFF
ncbi:MAG: RluA family pseudouridine synthase [Chlamydiota bacterium]